MWLCENPDYIQAIGLSSANSNTFALGWGLVECGGLGWGFGGGSRRGFLLYAISFLTFVLMPFVGCC